MSATAYEFSDTGGQRVSGTQTACAPGVGSSAERMVKVATNSNQDAPALGVIDGSGDGHGPSDAQSTPAAPDPWHDDCYLLGIAAVTLDDIEGARIAASNRRRALLDDLGAEEGEPAVVAIDGVLANLEAIEHGCALDLKRAMRRHPLGSWVQATKGIGEKQGARLIAAVGGDPYLRPDGTPRTVSQLWAYCGYHVLHPSQPPLSTHKGSARVDPSSGPGQNACDIQSSSAGVAPSRRRGQRANWSTVAKSRAFLIAEACMKQRESPYRALYDATRAKYADATHAHPCQRCGPKGRPAEVGSPLSDGHKHARALRAVAKAVLRDMWREAKRVHEIEEAA